MGGGTEAARGAELAGEARRRETMLPNNVNELEQRYRRSPGGRPRRL